MEEDHGYLQVVFPAFTQLKYLLSLKVSPDYDTRRWVSSGVPMRTKA